LVSVRKAKLEAHAKINLGLKICGRRADGYHEISTIYQEIDLADELEFEVEPSPGPVRLEVEGADLPTDETNLVLRAAAELARRRPGGSWRTRVRLVKRVPVGGGLGGGSSDAAATLLALDALWDLHLSRAEMWTIARRIGADVPFFLTGGTALASGIGDVLEPVCQWEDPVGVLVVPEVQVSTRWAYSQVKIGLTKRRGCGKFRSFLRLRPRLAEWGRWLENDFEAVVLRAYPEIGELMRLLEQGGAEFARMSGSGACLFGLFSVPEQAVRAAEKVGSRARVVQFRFVRGSSQGPEATDVG
jgi:4-diphosphocytidyl-2-C-methyl-D-erythritol kinase